MDKLRTATWIIGSQKKLENIPNSVQGLNSFSATIWAGRCGRLLSNIRSREYVTTEQLDVFANSAGILTLDLDAYITPLEKGKLIRVKRSPAGEIIRVEDCLLTKEEVLEKTAELFLSKARELENANLFALDRTAEQPIEETELKQLLSKQGYKDQLIDSLIPLQTNFHLLESHSGYGLPKNFLFNEYIWGENPSKIIGAVGNLDSPQKQAFHDIVTILRSVQGKPLEEFKSFDGNLLKLLIKVGLLDVVSIQTAGGDEKEFVTTPQMWGTIKMDLLSDDILDDIKVFLNSIRYGEFYGKAGTGKIENPEILVRALLSKEKIGPCTAIGTDYIMLEKAGIVDVIRAPEKPGQFYMKLLKKEVGERVLEILKHGVSLPGLGRSQLEFDFPPAISYKDPETKRVRTKIATSETKEAFSKMIHKLRGI